MKLWKRKLLGVLLAAVMMFETMGLAMAAAPETMADKLAAVERTAYGTPQTGALLDRVNKLEKDFEGEHSPNESVMQRVDNLYATMFKNENGPSLVTRMNAIELKMPRMGAVSCAYIMLFPATVLKFAFFAVCLWYCLIIYSLFHD